ncbi:type IV secretion system protein VirB6 [Luteibacter sp. Sphag1AF]|uniref:type IV secretion system protein n=1 Tax=Luteibacter sp. Sphag1AF TaxID=2587031 RepID=UPI00160BD724|nr:type IV secretion system protein VirB6 [Luteibacter sp. Sphag1AF]
MSSAPLRLLSLVDPSNIPDFIFFGLIYKYLNKEIATTGLHMMARSMKLASGVALSLVTIWVFVTGYRLITGQYRESITLVINRMARITLIVSAASSMALFGGRIHTFFTVDMGKEINHLFTGEYEDTAHAIDRNLAYTQVALTAIDAVEVVDGDNDTRDRKAAAMFYAGVGTASPPMAAAAMQMLYQFTLAFFIGLGPLFILCLIFDQSKDLFRRWLLYGIGTLFSMAALNVVCAIAMKLSYKVAVAMWASSFVNDLLIGSAAEGLSSLSLQQGGVGLLMSVLIVSVPPMAAMFFQGTAGHFATHNMFGTPPQSQQQPTGGAANAASSQTYAPAPFANEQTARAATPLQSHPHTDTIKTRT